MAKYTGTLPSNFGSMNEAQQNDAVRALGFSGLSDFKDNANKISEGGNTTNLSNATPSGGFSGGGLDSSLAGFQSTVFGNASTISGVQSLSDIAKGLRESGLLPSAEAPTAPSLASQFQELSTAKGVEAIQKSIGDLKAEQDAIDAQLRTNKIAEKGKPVAQGVIEGRVSKETTQAQEQYDFVGRQLARKQDELNSTLSNIKMIMDFTQTDFTNASTQYNTKFDQAIATFNLINGVQQDQKTDVQRATDNARANLQIMANSIAAGNMDISKLSPDQQAQLNKLEVQSGLPVGFIQSIKKDPKADIVFTSTNNGVTQVGIRNSDGTVSVQSYGTAGSGKAKEPSYASGDEVAIAQAAFEEVDTNNDKLVSLAEFEKAKQAIYSQIADPEKAASALNTASNGYGRWNW